MCKDCGCGLPGEYPTGISAQNLDHHHSHAHGEGHDHSHADGHEHDHPHPHEHSHPHEQTGYLVKGRLRLRIGTREYEAQTGDSWCIPGGVEHGTEVIEDSIALEVFSPVRHDYLPGPEC